MRKKKMIIITALMITSVYALTACSSSKKTATPALPEEPSAKIEAETTAEEDVTSDAETETAESTSPAGDEKQQQTEPIFPVIKTEYRTISADDGVVLVSGQYPQIELSDNKNEQVAALINSWNKEIKDMVEQSIKEDEEGAKELREYGGSLPYEEDADVMIMRADEDVLSIRTGLYSYTGGAHGGYGIFCYNYNAATGQELSLDDVISDRNALYEKIIQTLNETYEKEMFFEGYEETVKDEVFEQEKDGYQPKLTWSVEPDGIPVYFMQYDIAPYAAGSLTVKLPYDGNEEMFANRLFVNENRVNPVAAYETTYVNVGGVRKALRLENVLENETYNNTVHIYLNDSEVSVDVEYGCSASYLIQKENGQQFLYLESKSDNDYRILHVVDLNQADPVYKGYYGNGSFYEQVPVNVERFRLSSRLDLLSTYNAERTYRVGADGMPEVLEETYHMSETRELTAKMDVPAFSGKSMDEACVIPAGTVVKLFATDGETWVDLKSGDETIYRVYVKREWPQEIDGTSIDDCFDGIIFAG